MNATTAAQSPAHAVMLETEDVFRGDPSSDGFYDVSFIPEVVRDSTNRSEASLLGVPAADVQRGPNDQDPLETAPGLHEGGPQPPQPAAAALGADGPDSNAGPVAEGLPARHKSLRSMPGDLAESVDEEAETTLMHRMIGVSCSQFRRMGRLKRGQHFGERECYLGVPRTLSMVTVTPSEMYCLERTHLLEAVGQWPELSNALRIARATLDATPDAGMPQ